MINVNQITSQLAKMPDQALQQYAMMHKNDPYTVSLALSESNRRKQMRDAAQGQQGMAPQPKVVDQGIAEMSYPEGQAQAMPEDVGIGALAAPNMQNFAEGGIVAFGGGGDVPRFGGGGFFEEWLNSNITPAEQKRRAFLQQQAEANRTVPVPTSLAEETARNRQIVADQGFTRGDIRFPVSAAPVAGQPAPLNASVPDTSRSVSTPRTPAARPATPEVGFADRLTKAMGTNPEEDRFAKRREEITNTAKTGAEEGLAKLKADQATDMAEMFKGREERVNKREAELTKSKDTNTGLAFLEAGLAMMQARGPGLSAIAQGAGVGVKQYAAGMDKLKSAQEKLDDARDRMEELRQNQASMNKREIRAEEKGIRDIVTQGQRDYLTGAKEAYGMKREDARAIATSDEAVRQKELDRQTDLKKTGIMANATPAQIQLINKLGGGDFQKGYEIYKQEAAVPRLYESYTKMTSDPLKGAEFQAKYPTFDTYLASSGMLGGKSPGIINMPNAAAGNVLSR